MIDRREIKLFDHELEESLKDISDTEVLLNLSDALKALYPYLIPIVAYAYDAWDDIVMPLFHEMVFCTFEFKYGINSSKNHSYLYCESLPSFNKINHIECIPKTFPLRILKNNAWTYLQKEDMLNTLITFKTFGDGKHWLTGGWLKKEEVQNMTFDLVEIDLIDAEKRNNLSYFKDFIFVHKDDVNFEFVAEI